jgi:hypothetical protein
MVTSTRLAEHRFVLIADLTFISSKSDYLVLSTINGPYLFLEECIDNILVHGLSDKPV